MGDQTLRADDLLQIEDDVFRVEKEEDLLMAILVLFGMVEIKRT